jgi:hypothetical protein
MRTSLFLLVFCCAILCAVYMHFGNRGWATYYALLIVINIADELVYALKDRA